jgi:hypothetical protein
VPYDVAHLLQMSSAELDQLFSSSASGDIPDGPAKGTAIIAPGTDFNADIADFINVFVWQGKTFNAKKGLLTNQILPFGLDAIIATVYKGPSWLDNNECIVLDYSQTSLIAQWVRDEIRWIDTGLYLGRVYWDGDPLIHFALEF